VSIADQARLGVIDTCSRFKLLSAAMPGRSLSLRPVALFGWRQSIVPGPLTGTAMHGAPVSRNETQRSVRQIIGEGRGAISKGACSGGDGRTHDFNLPTIYDGRQQRKDQVMRSISLA